MVGDSWMTRSQRSMAILLSLTIALHASCSFGTSSAATTGKSVYREVIVPEDLDAGTTLMTYTDQNFTLGNLSRSRQDGFWWKLTSISPLVVELATYSHLKLSSARNISVSATVSTRIGSGPPGFYQITFHCRLLPRKPPQFSPYRFVTLSDLFFYSPPVLIAISPPATKVLGNIHVSSTMVDCAAPFIWGPRGPTTWMYFYWNLLYHECYQVQNQIMVTVTIEDNGHGKYLSGIRAVGNAMSVANITINVTHPPIQCPLPNLTAMAIKNLVYNTSYVRLNNIAYLLKVKYYCNAGFDLIGPDFQLCFAYAHGLFFSLTA
eukprot:scpid41858/ scgid34122/ 